MTPPDLPKGASPDHRDEVAELRATVEVQQVGLNRLADQVRDLTALLHDLTTQTTAAPDGDTEPANPDNNSQADADDDGRPAPWCWRDMPPRQAAALFEELTDWVDWLHTRYPLAETVLPCWWRHPEVVEELTAAHAAWKAAYTSAGASPYGPGEWHDRWLPGLEHRLAGRWRSRRCTEHHQPTLTSSYGTAVDDPAALQAHIDSLRDDAGAPAQFMDLDEVDAAVGTGAAEFIGTDLGDPIYHRGQFWQPTADADAYQPITDPDTIAALNDARRRQRLVDSPGANAG